MASPSLSQSSTAVELLQPSSWQTSSTDPSLSLSMQWPWAALSSSETEYLEVPSSSSNSFRWCCAASVSCLLSLTSIKAHFLSRFPNWDITVSSRFALSQTKPSYRFGEIFLRTSDVFPRSRFFFSRFQMILVLLLGSRFAFACSKL